MTSNEKPQLPSINTDPESSSNNLFGDGSNWLTDNDTLNTARVEYYGTTYPGSATHVNEKKHHAIGDPDAPYIDPKTHWNRFGNPLPESPVTSVLDRSITREVEQLFATALQPQDWRPSQMSSMSTQDRPPTSDSEAEGTASGRLPAPSKENAYFDDSKSTALTTTPTGPLDTVSLTYLLSHSCYIDIEPFLIDPS